MATTTAEPTDEPPSGAGACSGTDENRAFFRTVAGAVDWPVYCPSLGRGWHVESGRYMLADGGRLEISYRGPGGSGLLLQEGAFCAGSECVPPGDRLGPAAFGDRDGALIRTADGWAVSVDGGAAPSWLLLVTGVDEAAARAIAAGLVRVSD